MADSDDDRRRSDRDAWHAVGLTVTGPSRVLTAGRSGSRVLAADTSAGPAVLKITADPARLERARREAGLLDHLAHRRPPVAPRLLGSAETERAVLVATAAGRPLPEPIDVAEAAWLAVARLLGALPDPASTSAGLPRSVGPVSAVGDPGPWRDLGESAAVGRGRSILLGPRPPAAPPDVLTHGDAHVGNVITDDAGRCLLIDWQEARIGPGLPDLVFCWQRAEFVGGRPPREAMLTAYADARGLDPEPLRAWLDRVELDLLLRAWPPFLGYGDDAGRERMRRRLRVLTR